MLPTSTHLGPCGKDERVKIQLNYFTSDWTVEGSIPVENFVQGGCRRGGSKKLEVQKSS